MRRWSRLPWDKPAAICRGLEVGTSAQTDPGHPCLRTERADTCLGSCKVK
jgi:hypothetical protein